MQMARIIMTVHIPKAINLEHLKNILALKYDMPEPIIPTSHTVKLRASGAAKR